MVKLFLDDVRQPPDGSWVVVRSVEEFKDYIKSHGVPNVISFDHDLGDGPTGHDAAKWLASHVVAGQLSLPSDFAYFVHSANPVGKNNIISIMESMFKVLDFQKE